MKKLQLQLTAGAEVVETIDLGPVRQLRLTAFAKANKLSLVEMILLAVDFSIVPEDQHVDLHPVEESEIIEFAAKMLLKEAA